jgi:hypothetical protein
VIARCLHRHLPEGMRVTLLSYPVGGLVILGAMDIFTSTDLANSAIARASDALTLTTTTTDVPGASLTITTQMPNTVVVVTAFFDLAASNTTGTDVAVGSLDVDGVSMTGAIIYQMQVAGVSAHRLTAGQQWRVTLADAGDHTLKLRASRTANTAGTFVVQSTHTTLAVLGYF